MESPGPKLAKRHSEQYGYVQQNNYRHREEDLAYERMGSSQDQQQYFESMERSGIRQANSQFQMMPGAPRQNSQFLQNNNPFY